ncbi:hypothetical protein L228DRAFT_118100 [Xylona heveae TC161]|uniref:Transcription factor SipA3 n=1 Tax=Xylona heveae (strain CBS 132557 / TC161) TaxID=1328760 RepID=A0A165HHF5_XYLHT|nr:hypothetical protein L228DRAFT_118100 [Xylona heveae TC161]KZF23524.1 hypothetical protein L228DRAFT_118100 [Xylona heveae TC161]
MVEEVEEQAVLLPAGKPLNLIPVGLKEAALDSPTFRATAIHYSDQIEMLEKWLDSYVKAATKLSHEVLSLEGYVNNFLTQSTPPQNISEAVLDHDYTLLAVRRYGEGAREYFANTLSAGKKMQATVIDPIKAFLHGELRNFKDARRSLEHSQKYFDNLLSRYAAQAKTKEPSALREDAFQLHEARKSYLKASLEFSVQAPDICSTLDKLLVKLFSELWREMRSARELMQSSFAKWGNDMDRVRGWGREMQSGEKAFKHEIQEARKQIEENVEITARPSRELEDYSVSTVPHLGAKGPAARLQQSGRAPGLAEKQGWLFLRTLTGKPARTVWTRRWFFVKNGIFGWLVQGSRSGGVEESERIGVLLCNVKPAAQEERRFCFEVMTKDTTIMLQAETQRELVEWLEAFDLAKRKALEDPASTDSGSASGSRAQEAAFAINPPSAPEFASKTAELHITHGSDESSALGFDRAATLTVPDRDGLASRGSFDIGSPRRSTVGDRDVEGTRDHAARIIQKLDLHRKTTAGSQLAGNAAAGSASPTPGFTGGGIASLISASHNILPVGPGVPSQPSSDTAAAKPLPSSTLAPSTLANPPAPTNMSKLAVMVSGERGIGVGRNDLTRGVPNGLMANLWGSTNWGYINRLERGELKPLQDRRRSSTYPSPKTLPSRSQGQKSEVSQTLLESSSSGERPAASGESSRDSSPSKRQRSMSLSGDAEHSARALVSLDEFPNYYPLPLKAQDYQFRMLFPNVPRDEKVLLVFRATWNPNDLQEFPGRVYVTAKEVYFYSNHLGLVLIYGVSLTRISEVTAATGRDCDFLFLHLSQGNGQASRVTIKTFLEPLRLLERRLNFLVQNANSETPAGIEDVLKELLTLEQETLVRSPSMDSWEDVSIATPLDEYPFSGQRSRRRAHELKAQVRVDRGLYGDPNKFGEGKDIAKFKLPPNPVLYVPPGIQRTAVEKEYDISPKALFHVMFGDKSAVFQMQFHERRAQAIRQGPWINSGEVHLRRNFDYQIESTDLFGRSRRTNVMDYQVIEVLNDHLCYVVVDKKTPWHLPHQSDYMLVSKIVITHVAKSKCKLAIYTKVEWSRPPALIKGIIEKTALEELHQDALDLADVISDQVRRLGPQSRTKKAIKIFGQVGQNSEVIQFPTNDLRATKSRRPVKRQTLAGLLFHLFVSVACSVMSTVLVWIFAGLRAIWKFWNSHAVILSLLLFSCVANLFLSTQKSLDWWTDRRATKFMTRLGVGPNTMISKAIYLKDLDTLNLNETTASFNSSSQCSVASFQEIVSLTDMDAPYTSAGTPFSLTSTKATARRLRRTRQNLGTYRHDLLVALRVVNNVEREMIRAEWENWLVDEMARCAQVDVLLRENITDHVHGLTVQDGQASTLQSLDVEGLDEIRQLHREYCDSCRQEHTAMVTGRPHLVPG